MNARHYSDFYANPRLMDLCGKISPKTLKNVFATSYLF